MTEGAALILPGPLVSSVPFQAESETHDYSNTFRSPPPLLEHSTWQGAMPDIRAGDNSYTWLLLVGGKALYSLKSSYPPGPDR